MSTLTKPLPLEIWMHIFDLLKHDKAVLPTCRLVSKAWNQLIERILGFLSARPELGLLVQKILTGDDGVARETDLIRILKMTPNLRMIHGFCSEYFLETLLTPRLNFLQLQEVPQIYQIYLIDQTHPINTPVYAKVLFCYKDTLKTVHIKLDEYMDRTYLAFLMNTIGQCKKITKLIIKDGGYLRKVKQLESILKFCKNIEDLKLDTIRSARYTHMEQSELRQWLTNNVKKFKTVKKLDIQDHSFRLPATNRERDDPDWMEYLAFKYPNVEHFRINCNYSNHQQIQQPMFQHLNTISIYGATFHDAEALKNFVNTTKNANVHVELIVIHPDLKSSPFVCKLNMTKETDASYTSFKITIMNDIHFDANLQTVLSIFSTKTIKRQTIALCLDRLSTLLYKLLKANVDVESVILFGSQLYIYESEPEPIESLRKVILQNMEYGDVEQTKRLGRMAPNLTHLTLSSRLLKDIELMPSSHLTQISIQDDPYFIPYQKNYERLLFHVSLTALASSHFFIAAKNKPLQIISRQEYETSTETIIRIECGTLQHLHVNIVNVKFRVEFDVEQGSRIKWASPSMEDSAFYALEKKYAHLEREHKVVQARYSKAKEHLSTSHIDSIEKD
ncbi:hypothetical protein MBANPS3_000885 [Mucor bainieri]